MSTPTSSQEGRHGGQRHRNQGCKLVGAGGGAEQSFGRRNIASIRQRSR